jgi:hypothetical protein
VAVVPVGRPHVAARRLVEADLRVGLLAPPISLSTSTIVVPPV